MGLSPTFLYFIYIKFFMSKLNTSNNSNKRMIAHNISLLNLKKGVQLVAVSKKKPIELIQEAYHAGQRIFGENYIQEAMSKIEYFREYPSYNEIEWHFLGHLQSNKVKIAAEYFDMIQSVDSEKIALKLNKACEDINKIMPILIQVNIGNEEQKSGAKVHDIPYLIEKISAMKNLELKGLMCIPPVHNSPRIYFENMKQIFDHYKERHGFDILSMGMSSDYNIAMSCGTNMVRIGTRIFGKR
jgi:pyridoxal phosphate enzyme (YggS family)